MSSSTWQKILDLGQEERNEIFQLYDDHKFPVVIRQDFACFIEDNWAPFLSSNDQCVGNSHDHQPYVEWTRTFQQNLIEIINSQMETNVKSHATFSQAKKNISKIEAGKLFKVLKFCLTKERELLTMHNHFIYANLKNFLANKMTMEHHNKEREKRLSKNKTENPLLVLAQLLEENVTDILKLQKIVVTNISHWKVLPTSVEREEKASIGQLQKWCELMVEVFIAFDKQLHFYNSIPDDNWIQTIKNKKLRVEISLQELLNSTLVIEKQQEQILSKNAKINDMVVRHLCLHKVLPSTFKMESKVRLYELDENANGLLLKGKLIDSEGDKTLTIVQDLTPYKIPLILEVPLTKDKEGEAYWARFSGCKFTQGERGQKRTNGKLVMEAKSHFYFKLQLKKCEYFNELSIGVTSSPFIITSHGCQTPKTSGKVFWDNLVAKLPNRGKDIPKSVPLNLLLDMLEEEFKSKTGRPLTSEQVDYLKNKLVRPREAPSQWIGGELQILEDDFWKNKMIYRNRPLDFSFYSWFYGILDLIETCLKDIWTDKRLQACMLGFMPRSCTENRLIGCPPGTFVTRFSESTFAALTISYVGEDGKDIGTTVPITKQELQHFLIPKTFLKHAFSEKVIGIQDVTFVYNGRNSEPFNSLHKEDAFEAHRLSPKERCDKSNYSDYRYFRTIERIERPHERGLSLDNAVLNSLLSTTTTGNFVQASASSNLEMEMDNLNQYGQSSNRGLHFGLDVFRTDQIPHESTQSITAFDQSLLENCPYQQLDGQYNVRKNTLASFQETFEFNLINPFIICGNEAMDVPQQAESLHTPCSSLPSELTQNDSMLTMTQENQDTGFSFPDII